MKNYFNYIGKDVTGNTLNPATFNRFSDAQAANQACQAANQAAGNQNPATNNFFFRR